MTFIYWMAATWKWGTFTNSRKSPRSTNTTNHTRNSGHDPIGIKIQPGVFRAFFRLYPGLGRTAQINGNRHGLCYDAVKIVVLTRQGHQPP